MANRECNGYRFRVGVHRYCLWDGAVFVDDLAPIHGSKCPNCERKADGTNMGNVPVPTRTVKQAKLPNGRIVTYESSVIVGKSPGNAQIPSARTFEPRSESTSRGLEVKSVVRMPRMGESQVNKRSQKEARKAAPYPSTDR